LCEIVSWIYLGQDRTGYWVFMKVAMKRWRISWEVGNFRVSWANRSCSGSRQLHGVRSGKWEGKKFL